MAKKFERPQFGMCDERLTVARKNPQWTLVVVVGCHDGKSHSVRAGVRIGVNRIGESK